ncbi:MAG TPA: hypothetical protein PKX87_00030 [Alphaproteobacteria bacterium]|nr:hypothetical protein [Alphaproteobacteria bacterium]
MTVRNQRPFEDAGSCALDLSDRPIPAPGTDVEKYVRELDLRDMFNFLVESQYTLQPKRSFPIFQGVDPTSSPEEVETLLGGLPETSYRFYSDHQEEFSTHAKTVQALKQRAQDLGRRFEDPKPPYPSNHCRMEFARHVCAVAQTLDDGAGRVNLRIYTPFAPLPCHQPCAVLAEDDAGYRLVLSVSPA